MGFAILLRLCAEDSAENDENWFLVPKYYLMTSFDALWGINLIDDLDYFISFMTVSSNFA